MFMRSLTLVALVGMLAIGVTSIGCTVDESVEDKLCDMHAPRHKQCITGYSCTCEANNECYCRRTSSLGMAPEESPALGDLPGLDQVVGPTPSAVPERLERAGEPMERAVEARVDRAEDPSVVLLRERLRLRLP